MSRDSTKTERLKRNGKNEKETKEYVVWRKIFEKDFKVSEKPPNSAKLLKDKSFRRACLEDFDHSFSTNHESFYKINNTDTPPVGIYNIRRNISNKAFKWFTKYRPLDLKDDERKKRRMKKVVNDEAHEYHSPSTNSMEIVNNKYKGVFTKLPRFPKSECQRHMISTRVKDFPGPGSYYKCDDTPEIVHYKKAFCYPLHHTKAASDIGHLYTLPPVPVKNLLSCSFLFNSKTPRFKSVSMHANTPHRLTNCFERCTLQQTNSVI